MRTCSASHPSCSTSSGLEVLLGSSSIVDNHNTEQHVTRAEEFSNAELTGVRSESGATSKHDPSTMPIKTTGESQSQSPLARATNADIGEGTTTSCTAVSCDQEEYRDNGHMLEFVKDILGSDGGDQAQRATAALSNALGLLGNTITVQWGTYTQQQDGTYQVGVEADWAGAASLGTWCRSTITSAVRVCPVDDTDSERCASCTHGYVLQSFTHDMIDKGFECQKIFPKADAVVRSVASAMRASMAANRAGTCHN